MSPEPQSTPQPTGPNVLPPLTPEERKAQSRRNLAVAGFLGLMVVIFFIVTIVQLSGNVAQRPY